MNNMFRLKKELIWNLTDTHIEVFCNNRVLTTEISTEDDRKVFNFLTFLSAGKHQQEIDAYSLLSDDAKNDILSYLITNKYGVWENEHQLTKYELFYNSFPNQNYADLSEQLDDVSILIIGVGTSASYLLESLSNMGVKKFVLIDGDRVEEKNIESQNYSVGDIGQYKANTLKDKYNKCKIKVHNEFVNSFEDIERIVNISHINYVILAVDNIELPIKLITEKVHNKQLPTLIYTSYGVLNQSYFKIKYKEDAVAFLELVYATFPDTDYYLSDNSGTILNALFSSFAITKLIIDDILDPNASNYAYYNFYDNRIFIGNQEQVHQQEESGC